MGPLVDRQCAYPVYKSLGQGVADSLCIMRVRTIIITNVGALLVGACSLEPLTPKRLAPVYGAPSTSSASPYLTPLPPPPVKPELIDKDDMRCLRAIRAYQANLDVVGSSATSLLRDQMESECAATTKTLSQYRPPNLPYQGRRDLQPVD